MVEYAVEFGTLAAESGLDEVALQGTFRRGLTDQVRDALVTGVRPGDLNKLIDCAIELDNYQRKRRRERALFFPLRRAFRHDAEPLPLPFR